MKATEECLSKVKKDCFRFIKSQETSTEKFGNKERMLKFFLMIRRPPRSTLSSSSAASDVYKRQN